jgi:hypothetical protein
MFSDGIPIVYMGTDQILREIQMLKMVHQIHGIGKHYGDRIMIAPIGFIII